MITIKNSEGKIIKQFSGDLSKTLLKQLELEGIKLDAACYKGDCAACLCEIEDGEENINKSFRGEPGFPLGDEEVMTCIAGIKDENQDIVLKTIF